MNLRSLALSLAAFVLIINFPTAKSYPFDTALLQSADSLREEKSYQLAISKYEEILRLPDFPADMMREIKFKLADCVWRSGDEGKIENAKKDLKELVDSKDHDRWRAEASESLAELYQSKDRWNYQNDIKQYIENARDFWAGSSNIKLARRRFINISFTYADYISQNFGWYYQGITPLGREVQSAPSGVSGLSVVYGEILKIADSDLDKARATYGLAMSYFNSYSDAQQMKLAEKYFKEVLSKYKESEWLDDAYYQLGLYYERSNEFDKALGIYREFASKFPAGQSQWVDQIQARIKEIAAPALQVGVGYNFLPGSEVQVNWGWRNLSEAQITFYKIDLLQALSLNYTKAETDYERGVDNYQTLLTQMVDSGKYQSLPTALSWKKKLKDDGKHQWTYETKGLAEWQQQDEKEPMDPKKGILAAGAYLLVVKSESTIVYDLVTVSDLGLVSKTAGHSNLFYVFDGKTGEPKKSAKIKYQYRYYNDKGNWVWEEGSGATDDSGLLNVPLKVSTNNYYNNQHSIFAVVSDGTMQAFSQSSYYSSYGNRGPWWIYAYSDRPAYRPNEEISFRGIIRQRDSGFKTPSGMRLKGRIYDALGNQVKEATYVLNEFGSFYDTLTLDDKAPLGEYRIQLWTEDMNTNIGDATLFRLEEYKLPEFTVNINPQPLEDKKQGSTFRLGDTVVVELNAEYYFGGPVANAEVEYFIYQNYYYHYYYPPRPYEWYYDNMQQNSYGDKGTLVTQGKIKTDSEGKAIFHFETPAGLGNDLKYFIEARVVDQSRREIHATSEIKVMRTSFLAYLNSKQNLYRPGDRAEIEVKTLDANNEPVPVEGKIVIKRNWWIEPLKEKAVEKPLSCESCLRDARVIQPGHYEETEILTKFVKTNERGEAIIDFQPERDGYYTINYTGFDSAGTEVQATASVYVCDKQSKDLGYKYGGIQIIPEKETFHKGDTARVMLVADRPDTWVLFTSEAEEIHQYQLIHLEGPVKLLEVPVTENDTPNIFLSAVSANDYQLKSHMIQIIVVPDDNFLNVKISSDKEMYSPREKATYDIEVTDKNGKPVSAEIGLGVTDSSVYYIQSEYVSDIRKFFYGEKRQHFIQTQTSFYQRPYMKLVRSDDMKTLMTETEAKKLREGSSVSGAAGGVYGLAGAKADISGVDEEKSKIESTDSASRMRSMGAPALKSAVAKEKNYPASAPAALEQGKSNEGLAAPTVRTDFRSTIFWQPSIVTDQDGKAKLSVEFPDSLTTWRTTARAITSQTAIGNMTHETKTKQDIIVRLQAPRFFTERDQATISANVNNYTDKEQKVKVTLDASGMTVNGSTSVWVNVPSNSEIRVDWSAVAEKAGIAELTVMAQTETVSDAMRKSFPIIPHGIEKFIAQSVVLKGNEAEAQKGEFTLEIPKERIPQSTSLRLILSPSLAAAMLDALPYLADYPYGCVEQTMSRFLPAVIVRKTMRDLGFSEKDANDYIQHVFTPREDPKGHPRRREDITLYKLDQMTRDGLNRLYDFQHSDGGWGWWKEGDSDRFMSAYVVWGLSLARDAGISIRQDTLSRAISYLQIQLVEEENDPDMLAWMLHALAQVKSQSTYEDKQLQRLWDMRDKLNSYTRALFALSEHFRGRKEHAEVLARNIINGIKEDKENGTAHWGESGVFYRWSDGGVESTAFNIKAMANIAPTSPQLEPAVKWLALNRRGASWKNTRDTAIAILGLADYLKTTTELTPDYEYEILVNGKSVGKGKVNAENMFTFERYIDLSNEALVDDKNTVSVTMKGKGALYLSGHLKYFTLEENITPAGNEVFVERQYFREEKKETLLKGYTSDWKPLKEGDVVKSGDRIRVELTLEAKNNYEYIVAEDYKPAGCEAVELNSGSSYADVLNTKGEETDEKTWIYQEFRDQKAAFFISHLKQGKHRIRYELRAEVPGEFHGMPDQVHAMYVPEIRANSSEARLTISDKANE